MKYIIFERKTKDVIHVVPIIFPNNLVHSMVAEQILKLENMQGYKAVSAGEYSPLTGSCYGGSDTLNLKSDPTDEKTIQYIDYCSHY